MQFSKTSPLNSGESSEKSGGENYVKSCHVCGCHGFFGPDLKFFFLDFGPGGEGPRDFYSSSKDSQHFPAKERFFSEKGGRHPCGKDLYRKGNLVKGLGHSVNRRTLKTEKLLSSSPPQDSPPSRNRISNPRIPLLSKRLPTEKYWGNIYLKTTVSVSG